MYPVGWLDVTGTAVLARQTWTTRCPRGEAHRIVGRMKSAPIGPRGPRAARLCCDCISPMHHEMLSTTALRGRGWLLLAATLCPLCGTTCKRTPAGRDARRQAAPPPALARNTVPRRTAPKAAVPARAASKTEVPARAASNAPSPRPHSWRRLQPGVEYLALPVRKYRPSAAHKLHLVRIDSRRATLFAGLASRHGGRRRPAHEWARRFGLSMVINLGMFQADHRSNVGYLRVGKHRNNPRWHKKYFSVLAFGPRRPDLPPARILDLLPGTRPRLDGYRVVVQNLRLIKESGGRGRNVWSEQPRRWSEAALAADRQGRLLMVFCRTPFRMFRFNRLLLGLDLGIVRAMHLEGGPEASLSIHAGGVDLDLAGSFETSFLESDTNPRQWPIPNVLGVKR